MKFGLGIMCVFEDEAPEAEGTVIFDGCPKVGDTAVLSDGHVWEVVSFDERDTDLYPVKMKRKGSTYVSN